MFDNLRMGLKPRKHLYSTNPFTKVNGNLYINSNFVDYLLPSALADGFYKFLLNKALATFLFVSVKRLIQKFYSSTNVNSTLISAFEFPPTKTMNSPGSALNSISKL